RGDLVSLRFQQIGGGSRPLCPLWVACLAVLGEPAVGTAKCGFDFVTGGRGECRDRLPGSRVDRGDGHVSSVPLSWRAEVEDAYSRPVDGQVPGKRGCFGGFRAA